MKTFAMLSLLLGGCALEIPNPDYFPEVAEAEEPYHELEDLPPSPELFLDLGAGFTGEPVEGAHTMAVLVSFTPEDPVLSGVVGVPIYAGFIYPGCEDLDGDPCHECLPNGDGGCLMETPGFIYTNSFGVASFRMVTHEPGPLVFAAQIEGRPETRVARSFPEGQ